MSTIPVVNMEIPQSTGFVCQGAIPTLHASNALFAHFYFPEFEREIVIRYISGTMTLNDMIHLLNTKFELGFEISQNNFKFSFDPEFFTRVEKLSDHLQQLSPYQFMDKIANRRIYVKTRGQSRDIGTDTFFDNQSENYIGINCVDLSSVSHRFLVYSHDTVHTLKKHLVELYGVPIDNQRVIFNGRELLDDRTLSESGLINDSNIKLVVRNRAGPYDWNYQRPESNPRMTIYNHESDSIVRDS